MLKFLKSTLLLALTMLLISPDTTGQQALQHFYRYRFARPDTATKLNLRLNSGTFFNNKEYFGTETEGYTLTGAYLQPVLTYSITRDLSLSAGIHLLQYFGREGLEQKLPVLSIDYAPAENFHLLIGSYNGGERFQLPEAMYMPEKQLTGLLNNGLLIEYSSPAISSSIWLNWEQLIFPADTFQEMFTFGTSNIFTLQENDQGSLKLPLWAIVHHKGGQINNSSEKVVTKTDLGSGIEYIRKTGNDFFKEILMQPLIFADLDERNEERGFAFQPQVGFRNDFMEISVGAFWARKYQSYWGNPILFSPR